MAFRRAASSSRSPCRFPPVPVEVASSWLLQSGQRFAKPGLPGLNSNSSPQIAQIFIGYVIPEFYDSRSFSSCALSHSCALRTTSRSPR